MNENIVEVSNFSYSYGDLEAVKDISFQVKKGEVFSFLGPNGAGKSTVINTLITLLPLQKGTVHIAGYDLGSEQENVRQSIGIVFQKITLDKDMTVRETLEFHGSIYQMGSTEKKNRITELLNLVELTEKADLLVSTLSGGMKRRLEIARGLMTRPKVLFLDEPTIGLDPQTRRKTWDYLRSVNNEGTTVFMTTHYMDEADLLSDQIALIDHGKIVIQGTPAELKQSLGNDIVYLETSDNTRATEILRNLSGVRKISCYEGKLLITSEYDGTRLLPEIIREVNEGQIDVCAVNLKKPSMDDVFLHYTGTEMRD
ncbi:MAG TPA: ATP-binding cassette domain-containing protein [Methanospirillum sp.]|uniref:ATP-binding cassette domain-containing protein n=1 Tax=Methanospirillum sp. TaxID=45200 RepID=UPI002CE5B019|nr:ATP-binding cassette domain-containing protein [Methanospirillum sp.]HWQ62889.1 ATP-binding cassette domain-containing protein [Methanospirillum sp.]